MNRITEMRYLLEQFRRSAEVTITDQAALASVESRLDNLISFLEYLRSEGSHYVRI